MAKNEGPQEWYAAKGLAGLPGLPKSEYGVTQRAKREDWKFREVDAKGGPGGKRREYHISALHEAARIALVTRTAGAFCPLPTGDAAAAGARRGRQIAEESAASAEQQRIAKEKGQAEFNRLPEARKQEAYAKLELLQARDAFIKAARLPLKRGSEVFALEYQAGRVTLPEWVCEYARRTGRLSVSWSSLNRWKKDYEAQGLIGLVNGYKGRRGDTSVPQAMQEFIVGLKVEHPHIKFKRVMDAIKARFHGQPLPHEASVRRFVKHWEVQNKSLVLFLTNPDEWKNRHMFAFGDAAAQIERLNQRWEFDSTPGDVMLKDGRHTILGVIDVWSRRLKLLVAPTSRATAVAALLRRAILDWGVLEVAGTDNGADYVSAQIVTVLHDLEVVQDLCPPFTPEGKPFIERAFKTFSHGIVELLPGYIGHNVADRKAIEARKTFAQRLMKRGETVEVNLTADEFQTICDRWVVAIYHQDVHSKLGCSPAEKARTWAGPVRRIHDERALDMLLSTPASNGGWRTITKEGIRTDRGNYLAAEFAGHEGQRVRVLEDATDWGTIYVYLESGEYLCAAIDPARTGHDRAEIAARAKAIQKKIMQDGRRELKKIARAQATDQIYEEILQHREGQIANLRELPQRSETYTTDALKQAGYAAADRDRRSPVSTVRIDREALKQEMERKVVAIPQDDRGRYRFWCALERRVNEGATLNGQEQKFFNAFQRTGIWRAFREVEQDLAANK